VAKVCHPIKAAQKRATHSLQLSRLHLSISRCHLSALRHRISRWI